MFEYQMVWKQDAIPPCLTTGQVRISDAYSISNYSLVFALFTDFGDLLRAEPSGRHLCADGQVELTPVHPNFGLSPNN